MPRSPRDLVAALLIALPLVSAAVVGASVGPSARSRSATPARGPDRRLPRFVRQGDLDAYLWVKHPGESDGTCNGGPAAGLWWRAGALALLGK